jgi:tRNA pseudouridine38-40 synthase
VKNIKLTIAYDGQAYLGWQKTSTGPSIEATLQQVLEQILQHPVVLQAASRTDAGVHAKGQVVNFFTEDLKNSLKRFHASLNGLLPSDIVVLSVCEEHPDFHPTLNCIGKEYRYTICNAQAQLPQNRFYSWHYPYPLDIDKMLIAAKFLQGTHDFSTLCNFKKNSNYTDWIREVSEITITKMDDNQLQICVKGKNFLYKMVRNIVGTLAHVGRGLILPNSIPSLLNSQDRTQAGVTAPAHGLCLYRVYY